MLPLAARLDHHAHVLALLEGADGAHRRGEIDHVEPPAQRLRQGGLQEIDHDVLALGADVDAGRGVGKVHHHPALAARSAPKVHVPDLMLGAGAAFGEVRDPAVPRALGDRRLGERDDERAAVDRGLVRHRAAQVEHEPGAVGALHDVHAAQFALCDVLARAAERARRIGEVEGNARRVGHGEVGRHALQRLARRHPHHRLAALLRHLDVLDGIRLRRGDARARKAQQ